MKDNRKRALLRFFVRVVVIWAIQVVGLVIMAWLLPGVSLDSLGTAILAAAVIGLVNALLWPILSYVILPFAVLTLGLLSLVLNAVLLMLASALVAGFTVNNLGSAILLALGLAVINTILSSLLTIDDDNSWYRNVVQRRMKRRGEVVETDVPGVLFLEIDGLSQPVLEKAIREGYVPTMARWLETENHRLMGWETDLSSQTSASQAGLLHGNNSNIPAFRWYDRARKMIVASSNPDELARLEKELSDGNGLLVDDGASRGNMFSGDAPNVMNTASTIKDLSRFHTADFGAYFINPYNFTRTLILFVWDIILEKYQFWQARRKDVQPRLDRHKRGGKYPLMRGFMTIFLRELNVYTLIGDMYAGVPSAYTTFGGYDEVAHHSGVESKDALDVLHKIDQQFARMESAAKEAPRPYRFVILSDHGQSAGATFKQRYHMTLEDLVQKLAAEYQVVGDVDVHEDWNQASVFLTEAVQHDQGAVQRPLRSALKGSTQDDGVVLGPEGKKLREGPKEEKSPAENEDEQAQIVVLASGNLGLIYGTRLGRRAVLEEIEEVYPGLLEGLASHEGVGFLMVRSEAHGPVVVGAMGRYYLAEDRVEGDNPLDEFGPNAAQHLSRSDSFPDAPDILVNSFCNHETNEVAAFEELIGSHGGLGGYQTQPFVLYPVELPVGDAPLVGAAAVHRVLKEWASHTNGKEIAPRES
jgi:putative membrane protein